MTYVWATRIKVSTDKYRYNFRYGNRPTKASFIVGELDQSYNPETGEDGDIEYRSNGSWPQPSYYQVLGFESSINQVYQTNRNMEAL